MRPFDKSETALSVRRLRWRRRGDGEAFLGLWLSNRFSDELGNLHPDSIPHPDTHSVNDTLRFSLKNRFFLSQSLGSAGVRG
jgi:hypothetical protein